jgi:hypothetical protein
MALPLLAAAPLCAPAVNDLGELARLAGHWPGAVDGMQTEEFRIEPRAGIMLGVSRTMRGGENGERLVFFEYTRVVKKPDGIFSCRAARRPPSHRIQAHAFRSARSLV